MHRLIRFAICMLHFSLWISPAFAVRPYAPVHPDPVAETWRWTVYPELRGLGLWCLGEDRDGNLWFGGRNGVRRYDGLDWTSFTDQDGLTPGLVLALRGVSNGSVYAGSYTGIARFSAGNWERVFPRNGSFPTRCTDFLEDSAGDVWASSWWGPLRLSGDTLTLYVASGLAETLSTLLPEVTVLGIPDSAVPQRTWKDGIGAKFWALADGQVLVLPVMPGSPAERAGLESGDRIRSVNGDPGGTPSGPAGTTLALAVDRNGLPGPIQVQLTVEWTQKWTWYNLDTYDLFEDREGALWIGLGYGEIIRWEGRERDHDRPAAWRLYDQSDGLDPGSGPRILQARDGIVWVVWRNDGGISRFDGDVWRSFRIPDAGTSHHNPSILQTRDGTVWVGEGLGRLHAYRDGRWTTYRRPALPVPSSDLTEGLLEASDGSLWIAGADQEAVRLEYATSRFQTYQGLHFQCETRDAVQWFVSDDGGVIRRSGKDAWDRYGSRDGLMNAPLYLFATGEGDVFAVGRHNNKAAVARFQDGRWVLHAHPDQSWAPYRWQGLEAPNGDLWLMARGNGGLLRFDGTDWVFYASPAPPDAIGIAQTPDGTIWTGNWDGLYYLEGNNWRHLGEPAELRGGVFCLCVSADSSLWVGTPGCGILRYHDGAWSGYDVDDGLASNRVESVIQTGDGTIWAATDEGVSRFDGRSWTSRVLPMGLTASLSGTELRRSRGSALWLNCRGPSVSETPGLQPRTIRYLPESGRPETEITLSVKEVSQPGNTTVEWAGRDPWRLTPTDELQFSYRLDDREWTPFAYRTNVVLTSLASGGHTLQVKARDRDYNEDATPAIARFTVVPPVWQQPWFIGMTALLLSGIGYQTARVMQRDRRLTKANEQLLELDTIKTEFFSNISHELQQPITAVTGRLDNLRDGTVGQLNKRQAHYVARAIDSMGRMTRLVRTLLDLARLDRNRPDLLQISVARLALHEVIPDAVEGLRNAADEAEVALVCSVPEIYADADRDRLIQVITNLVSNAIKFTERGGEARVAIRAENGFACVEVQDTGRGIPPEDLPRIFERFYRVKAHGVERPGTGLGLPISRELVELQGGKIWVTSEVGVGSTFTFTVPMA